MIIKVDLGPTTILNNKKEIEERLESEALKKRPWNVFDYTMISTYLTCQRKYYNRHELNLISSEGTVPLALLMGRGMHHALHVYYEILKTSIQERCKPPIEDIKDSVKRAFFNDLEQEIRRGEFPPNNNKRSVERAFYILDGYIDNYGYDAFEEILGIEEPFAIILPYQCFAEGEIEEGEIVYVGRRDLHAMMNGVEHIIEHKTSSMLTQSYFATYDLSFQVSGYLKSACELTGRSVRHCLVNVVAIYAKGLGFSRYATRRDADALGEFERQIAQITADILKKRAAEKLTPGIYPDLFWQNHQACNSWNTLCQYHPLCCKHTRQQRENFAEMYYEKAVWSPYDIIADSEDD